MMKHLASSLGVAVFFIGLSAVMGYCLGFVRLYHWHESIGMALNTSIGFTLTGLAIWILSNEQNKVPPR